MPLFLMLDAFCWRIFIIAIFALYIRNMWALREWLDAKEAAERKEAVLRAQETKEVERMSRKGRFQHDRQKSRCNTCCTAGLCEHNRRKRICRNCKGSGICEHDRQKNLCRDCKGPGICEHDRRKTRCKDCKASGL